MKTQHVLQVGGWVLSSILGGALLGACASSGTKPHDMTAGQHQTAAQTEEQAAAQHQAQYDPSQTKTLGPTGPSMGAYSACIEYQTSNCDVRWRSTENPTEGHVKEAQKHKKLAEKHRAASKALIEAEQRFCSGIPEADRDLSPFYHREDVTAAQGIKKKEGGYGRTPWNEVVQIQQVEKEVFGPGGLQGARITFRAVPGMTGEWLQRTVDCHLARNAVVGSDATMSFCPLAVPHATATVTSTGAGFAVDITSDDANSAQEIVKRAWTLGPTSGSTVLK
jgi:hypothetical protein